MEGDLETHRGHVRPSTVVMSQASTSRSSSTTAGNGPVAPTVESTVTRLLVSIKQLLESLTSWSQQKIDELAVSNSYVKFGNDFNASVIAFQGFGIDMADFLSVPNDLRLVLEQCLSEEATEENLEIYLPTVRQIITNLLQGLRGKQSIYRRLNADRGGSSGERGDRDRSSKRSHKSSGSRSGDVVDPSVRASRRPQSGRRTPHSSSMSSSSAAQPPPPTIPEAPSPREGDQFVGGFAVEAPAPSPGFGHSQESSSGSVPGSASSRYQELPARTDSRNGTRGQSGAASPHNVPMPMSPPVVPASVKRYSLVDKPMPPSPPVVTVSSESNPSIAVQDDEGEPVSSASSKYPTQATQARSPAAAAVPIPSSPPVVMNEPAASPNLPAPPPVPFTANTLAAINKDPLERRASKRFSTYNISKMSLTSPSSSSGSGSGKRDKWGGGSERRTGEKGSKRRSLLAGGGNALTPGELYQLTEEDENNNQSPYGDQAPAGTSSSLTTPIPEDSGSGAANGVPAERSSSQSKANDTTPSSRKTPSEGGKSSSEDHYFKPRLPPSTNGARGPVPESISTGTISAASTSGSVPSSLHLGAIPRPAHDPSTDTSSGLYGPSKFHVFLQVGREVKKVEVEPANLSFSSLRVIFVDKFSYNPGMENFPAIYIRDPSSGVQYELEDVAEVREGRVLSLNIEPLDQIKQHIDAQIGALCQDIKDLKSAVASNNRQSSHLGPPSPIVAQPLIESTPAPRPSDRQFQTVARRLSKFIGNTSTGSIPSIHPAEPMPSIPFAISNNHQQQQLQYQMTGSSTVSEYSSRVVNDLKTQFDEVQNLRRDLGIMRQLYKDFMSSTKESLSSLRTQTQNVKSLANTSVGGARAYIASGKKQLDERSQNVLTDMEKLQDAVEGVRDDVLKRHVTPKTMYFKSIKKDIDTIGTELLSLKEHITTIKPMWKKTWQEELANIVEEQQFLSHQEEFLNDLLGDHKDVDEVYDRLAQVITLKGSNASLKGKSALKPGFRPPPMEEGHEGLSTVMRELKGAQVDSDQRMKAIEANQRNRQKELEAQKTGGDDGLQSELKGFFVDGKKLKMTGGAEEVERVRQKRNDMTLKAMFTGGGTPISLDTSAAGSAGGLTSPGPLSATYGPDNSGSL